MAVTDLNGAVYRQYVYDPYGNIISVKDGSGTSVDITNDTGFNNAYTYRGYRYDSETGLYFLNARYYAAGIGRFLTKDTFKGLAKDTQSLNRYVYCEGDPVNLTDPSGHTIFQDANGNFVDTEVVDADNELISYYIGYGGDSAPTSTTRNNGVNDANKLLVTVTRAIGDAKLEGIASGTAETILKKVGPAAGLLVGYDLHSDYVNYSGNSRWFAMTITGAGFVLGVGLTTLALGVMFPLGASAFVIVAVGVAIGIPIGLGTDAIKRRVLGK